MAAYVFVPGAGGDPWMFHLVIRELEAKGHEAIGVRLPTGDDDAGWTEYADAVEAAIGDRRSSVVLVAQSLAGFAAPLVCARRPVEVLVLLNAMIPVPGETGNDWWGNTGSGEAMRSNLRAIGLSDADAQDDRLLYFHDVPPAVDDTYEPAVRARGLAGRANPRHRRPGRPPVPSRVPAPCRQGAAGPRDRRDPGRPHGRAESPAGARQATRLVHPVMTAR
jgi:hypothetical protein